jgi:hypothetical protein
MDLIVIQIIGTVALLFGQFVGAVSNYLQGWR